MLLDLFFHFLPQSMWLTVRAWEWEFELDPIRPICQNCSKFGLGLRRKYLPSVIYLCGLSPKSSSSHVCFFFITQVFQLKLTSTNFGVQSHCPLAKISFKVGAKSQALTTRLTTWGRLECSSCDVKWNPAITVSFHELNHLFFQAPMC